MNREEELVRELQKNEQILQLVAWDDLVNEWATKNTLKTAAGYAAPAMDVASATQLIREVGGFKPNQVRFTTPYKGKQYVIFKGNPQNRRILIGTRYLTTNPTVVRLAVGPEAIKKSAKGGFAVTVVLSTAVEVWDSVASDRRLLSDLLGTVSGDVIKAGLGALAGRAVGIALVTTIVGTVAAGPMVCAIVAGLVVGAVLTAIDTRFGATAALIAAYEKAGLTLRKIHDDAEKNAGQAVWQMERRLVCHYAPVACGGY